MIINNLRNCSIDDLSAGGVRHLLVYGTLRKGASANSHMRGCNYIGTRTIPKEHFSLWKASDYSWFPFMSATGNASDTDPVVDVYEVTDPHTWHRLDRYEGFPDLYAREVVQLDDMLAAVYIGGDHLQSSDSRVLVPHQDWMRVE